MKALIDTLRPITSSGQFHQWPWLFFAGTFGNVEWSLQYTWNYAFLQRHKREAALPVHAKTYTRPTPDNGMLPPAITNPAGEASAGSSCIH